MFRLTGYSKLTKRVNLSVNPLLCYPCDDLHRVYLVSYLNVSCDWLQLSHDLEWIRGIDKAWLGEMHRLIHNEPEVIKLHYEYLIIDRFRLLDSLLHRTFRFCELFCCLVVPDSESA